MFNCAYEKLLILSYKAKSWVCRHVCVRVCVFFIISFPGEMYLQGIETIL